MDENKSPYITSKIVGMRPAGDAYINTGVNNGHMGPVHNVGRRLQMTEEVMAAIAARLDRSQPVGIVYQSAGGTSMAKRLRQYLNGHGFIEGATAGLSPGVGEFDRQITISRNGFEFGGVIYCPDDQAVALEPDANP